MLKVPFSEIATDIYTRKSKYGYGRVFSPIFPVPRWDTSQRQKCCGISRGKIFSTCLVSVKVQSMSRILMHELHMQEPKLRVPLTKNILIWQLTNKGLHLILEYRGCTFRNNLLMNGLSYFKNATSAHIKRSQIRSNSFLICDYKIQESRQREAKCPNTKLNSSRLRVKSKDQIEFPQTYHYRQEIQEPYRYISCLSKAFRAINKAPQNPRNTITNTTLKRLMSR